MYIHFLNREIPKLHEEELVAFAKLWDIRKTLKKGEILKTNMKDQNLYYIKKGAIKICCLIEEKEVILEFGYPGLCIFNLPAFITDKHPDTTLSQSGIVS